MRTVYLDNNATTRVDPEVRDAMMPFFSDHYGNASSMHTFGGRNKQHIDTARGQVAALVGCEPAEIVFTSCGTESDNAAVRGAVDALAGRKHHLITTRVEHLAVLSVCQYLGKHGYRVTELPVDGDGMLDLDRLADTITDDTAIVSIMWANNETGVVFPVEAIGALCRDRGVTLHTDAVQAAGKLPINLHQLPVDLLSLSGHKLHAPKGIGVLYVHKGTRISPFLIGGHQESNRRAGTENVPYIVGLGKACELAAAHLEDERARVRALRDKLERGILATCPDCFVNGAGSPRLPNTSNIAFEFIEGESILLMLDQHGICASSGSACTSGSLDPSHVMRAMGVPFTAAHGSTRFSLSRYTTEAEIDYTLERVPPIIHRLRELSPFVAAP